MTYNTDVYFDAEQIDDRYTKAAEAVVSLIDNAIANGDWTDPDATVTMVCAQTDVLLFARNCVMDLLRRLEQDRAKSCLSPSA
jgi:hypothetical protein